MKHVLALALIAAGALPALADDTLSIAAPWELLAPDPASNGYAFTRMQVAETLVGIGPKGELLPRLATGWTMAEDGLSWRFAIRPGVTFHDGSALTAEGVAKVLTVALGKPGLLSKAGVEAITAEGNEVVLRLKAPYAPMPATLAHYSTLILAPETLKADGTVDTLVGTGPYRVTRFEPPQKMEVEANPTYWGDAPHFAKAEYLAVSRGETRALMAESGDAEIVLNLDPASVGRLKANKALTVESRQIPRVIQLKVNAGMEQMASADLRRALSLAIDRKGIATALLRAPDLAADQLFPPSLPEWRDDSLPPLAHDPAEAAKILDAAGWAVGADGVRAKDGKRMALTIRTYADRPELILVSNALQEQFRQIGVAVEVAIVNSSDIPAGHKDGTLEMALVTRNYALVPDPLGVLRQDFTRDGGGEWGAMGWSSEAVEAAVATLLKTPAGAEAEAARKTIADTIQADLPVIPVTWYDQTAAVSATVKGFAIDPYEHDYGLSRVEPVK